MVNERLAAKRTIEQTLKSIENSLNGTMQKKGTLLVSLYNAKSAKGTHFSIELGIAASEKVAMAAVSAIQSYQQVIDAHHSLAEERAGLSLPVRAYGDVLCEGAAKDVPVSGLRAVGA